MSEMPSGFEAAADADPGPRINGVVDVPRPGRVAGWAIDRADPEAAVTVTILREGRPMAEVRADAYRPDLERGGIGTGRYGFAVDLDPPLEPGMGFTVTAIARADDGTTGEIRQIGGAALADDPGTRLAQKSFLELAQLRTATVRLAARQDRPGESRLAEAIDRIEIVQARIEQAAAGMEQSAPPARAPMLALAVALALACGAASLGLGIWSMIAG